jgi:hypothetical protein
VADGDVGERLEMLLVMRWLDAGAPDEGALDVAIGSAADALGLETDREGILAVMSALGELESRGAIDVAWPAGPAAAEARVTLAPELRRDARRLFGRT